MGMEDAAKRIAEKLQGKPTVEGIAQLPQSQWSSLQLAIDHLRAERLTAQGVLKHYTQSRFVHPGTLRPGDVCRVEAALLDLAEVCGFEPVLLSPVAPFGSCSVFGCVDQNNVLGAGRGVEVMADPTNALAFEIAHRIKSGRADPGKEMHLCAAARVVRGQMFSGEGMLPHFGIFCLVSRGRDSVGSYG